MALQADLKDAIEGGRDDLVEALATHRILPTVVEEAESSGSTLLGDRTPTFRLDEENGTSDVVDRQTTALVVDTLGLDSEEACEAAREEIRDHAAWGE